jgi:hypothetical protein
MGVGKTTTCRLLRDRLPGCVFLDGDWCWDMHPFVVNDETKAMVMVNIRHLLGNFLRCSAFENVVFCWVMHQQQIIDDILAGLEGEFELHCVSLVCSREKLVERLEKDVRAGIRQEDVIGRSVERLPLYDELKTVKIDVSEISPAEAAERIADNACIEIEKSRHTGKFGQHGFLVQNILANALGLHLKLRQKKIRLVKFRFGLLGKHFSGQRQLGKSCNSFVHFAPRIVLRFETIIARRKMRRNARKSIFALFCTLFPARD